MLGFPDVRQAEQPVVDEGSHTVLVLDSWQKRQKQGWTPDAAAAAAAVLVVQAVALTAAAMLG